MATLHYASGDNIDANGNFTPAQAGFNLADVSSVSELNALPAGVKGLVWLDQGDGVTQSFIDAVKPYIGNPNVYGFFLKDEPDPTGQWNTLVTAANLKAESDWIHANVPGAKTFITMMNMGSSNNPSFANTYTPENTHIDYFGIDPYPVRSGSSTVDYSMIDKAVAAAKAAGIPESQIVPVYQTFGGGNWTTDSGGRYVMPTADQAQQMLDHWAAVVPNPAFDYAYAWGSQNGDQALESSQALKDVFLKHNTSGTTPPVDDSTGGNTTTDPTSPSDPTTPPTTDGSGSGHHHQHGNGTGNGSTSSNDPTTPPTTDGSGSGHHHQHGSGTGNGSTSPSNPTTPPTTDGSGSGHHHQHGSGTGNGSTSSNDPTTPPTADASGSGHHHQHGSGTGNGSTSSSDPTTPPTTDGSGSGHHHQHGNGTGNGSTSSSDPTTPPTADASGSGHHHQHGNGTGNGSTSPSDPTTSPIADASGSGHHHHHGSNTGGGTSSSSGGTPPTDGSANGSTGTGSIASSDPTTPPTTDATGSGHHHHGLDFSQLVNGGTPSWCGHQSQASFTTAAVGTVTDTASQSVSDTAHFSLPDLDSHHHGVQQTDHHAWHW